MFSDCLEFAAWTDEGQWNSIPHKLRDNVSTNHIQGFYWLLVIHSCHSSSFCFSYLFLFVWIVLLVYCRHLPKDGMFNQKTLKYLHFDMLTNQQEFDHIWGTSQALELIVFLATKCQWDYGLLFKDPRGTTDFKWWRRSKDFWIWNFWFGNFLGRKNSTSIFWVAWFKKGFF